MTTLINVKHKGPNHHDIMVQIINPQTDGLVRETRLTMGQDLDVYLWDTQCIKVLEVPKAVVSKD